MIYNLKNPIELSKFKERNDKLVKSGATVELTEKKPNRTLPQNNYLHLILTYFAITYGYTLEETKKDYFKILCNKDLFVVEKYHEMIGKYISLRSSADLTTEEMTLAINRFKNYSAENGLPLPNSEDWHFLNHIRNLEKENAEWL